MTRVSTFSQNTLLLNEVLRNERRVFEAQNQIASGLKSPDFKGIARDTASLSVARNSEARTQQFVDTNSEIERKLNLYDLTLQELYDVAQELRQDIITAINTNSGAAFRTKIDILFDRVANALNTRDNGRYIFGGTRTDTAPVAETSLTELEKATVVTNTAVFANNNVKPAADIDQNLKLTYGVLAADVATNIVQALRRIMQFDAGNTPTDAAGVATGPAGAQFPISQPLTTAQRDFLIQELTPNASTPNVTNAIDTLSEAVAANGVNQKTLEDTQDRHQKSLLFIKIFISDIEDVDVAEAISRLNLDQLALEASFRVYGELTRLTILDFI